MTVDPGEISASLWQDNLGNWFVSFMQILEAGEQLIVIPVHNEEQGQTFIDGFDDLMTRHAKWYSNLRG